MMTKVAEWASEHAQITNIGLSDGYGEKAILTAVQFGYDRHRSQGYLGNVSLKGEWPAVYGRSERRSGNRGRI